MTPVPMYEYIYTYFFEVIDGNEDGIIELRQRQFASNHLCDVEYIDKYIHYRIELG